jgi:pyridoxine 4-oxidase
MQFDYVIIGAGTAGCVMAARLSEDETVSVCLIEAGGEANEPAISEPSMWPMLEGSEIDWAFKTTPQKNTANRSHAWARGRVIGGSSCINAMAHVRGHPGDFDRWHDLGCIGWGYADLLPYFIASESSPFAPSPYHGDTGPLRQMVPSDPHPLTQCFMAAAQDAGHEPTEEHNGAKMTGPTLNTLVIVDGKRQSVADAYLTPALTRANLVVRTNCLVDHLTFTGSRCSGVELIVDGQAETITAQEGVVLCAGVINSPAILMRSGIGGADELSKLGISAQVDLPSVGQNLHDHLLSGGNVYLSKREVPYTQTQHSESLLYTTRDGSDDAIPELVTGCVVTPAVTDAFEPPAFGEAYTLMFGFTHPKSRGTLRLQSADPTIAPEIDPNYLAEEYDREIYMESMDRTRDLGNSDAFSDWREKEYLPDGPLKSRAEKLEFLANAAFTHHHPVGTCRMGSDADAVVDPDLKVRGTEGLHIVDGSVIPEIPTGPNNAVIVAMAERKSDLLRRRTPKTPFDPRQLS